MGLVSCSFLSVACQPSADSTTEQQLDQIQADATDASNDLYNYTYEQKAEFVASMENKLAELDHNLDELSASINNSSTAVKAEATPRLLALRAQHKQLKEQLDSVSNATPSTWDSVKRSTGNAYDELKEGFQKSRQWLSEKIAP